MPLALYHWQIFRARARWWPTAVLAIALTMGTMNVYAGSAANGRCGRSPAPVRACSGPAGITRTGDLVRATSAGSLGVYVLSPGAATRMLNGTLRVAAFVALASLGFRRGRARPERCRRRHPPG